MEGHQVPRGERQFAKRAVGEELREEAGATSLRHDALGAAHVAQFARPSLVRVDAEDHELGRGLVNELVDGVVEQVPRRVDPDSAPVPVGRFVVGVEGENLLKPRLVELELRLEELDVRVLQQVRVETNDRRVGVNRAEDRVRLDNAVRGRCVNHVDWELVELVVGVWRLLNA